MGWFSKFIGSFIILTVLYFEEKKKFIKINKILSRQANKLLLSRFDYMAKITDYWLYIVMQENKCNKCIGIDLTLLYVWVPVRV